MDWYNDMKKTIEKAGGDFIYPVTVGAIKGIILNTEFKMTKGQKFDAIIEVIKAFDDMYKI